ncbi:uncharacterized protein [Chiloscyllium punctatum]|uniref:uncharacterized protein isoform X2 n=1 Tax=Chiloscyllium punctatum TaxID=137246 RepID=UPI003B63FD01
MERGFELLTLLLMLHSRVLQTQAERKEIFGAVGSSVLLDPEIGADLHNSEIIWKFTGKNTISGIILDYLPSYHKVKPNKQFKYRLDFNGFNGSLTLTDVKPDDQGNYTIHVNETLTRRIELFVFEHVKMDVYRTPQSSMFFPGVFENLQELVKVLQWRVYRGNTENGTEMQVLQFDTGATEPSLAQEYHGRLESFQANGSFVLLNLISSDDGLYTLFINQQNVPVRSIQLWMIDDLPKPLILSSSSVVGSTIMLLCRVSGQSHEYQWQKDGGNISEHHQLIDGGKSLIIPRATKEYCGTYTCTVINPISSNQAEYTLIIYAQLKFFLTLFAGNNISLIAILIALICWLCIQGVTIVPLVTLLFVSIILVFAVIAMVNVWNMDYLCMRKFLHKPGFRGLLDGSPLLISLTVIAISITILVEEIRQNDQGCSVTSLTWSMVGTILGIGLLIFAVYVTMWHYSNKKRRRKPIPGGAWQRKIQKMEGWSEKPLEDLLREAQKVFVKREDERQKQKGTEFIGTKSTPGIHRSSHPAGRLDLSKSMDRDYIAAGLGRAVPGSFDRNGNKDNGERLDSLHSDQRSSGISS